MIALALKVTVFKNNLHINNYTKYYYFGFGINLLFFCVIKLKRKDKVFKNMLTFVCFFFIGK